MKVSLSVGLLQFATDLYGLVLDLTAAVRFTKSPQCGERPTASIRDGGSESVLSPHVRFTNLGKNRLAGLTTLHLFITFDEQHFGQIRPVLSADTGDECFFHALRWSLFFVRQYTRECRGSGRANSPVLESLVPYHNSVT